MKRMKYNDSDYTPTDIEIVAWSSLAVYNHLQIIYTEYLINKSALCFNVINRICVRMYQPMGVHKQAIILLKEIPLLM